MSVHLSDRAIIAHHEAAHAVIAIELGLGILDIGIDLARVEVTGGIGVVGCHLFVADLTKVDEDIEKEQLRMVGQIDCSGTVLAAGAASDAKLKAEDPWLALAKQPADLNLMRELLARACLAETQEAEEANLKHQLDLAVEALRDPPVWASIESLARHVLEKGALSGREVEKLAAKRLEPN